MRLTSKKPGQDGCIAETHDRYLSELMKATHGFLVYLDHHFIRINDARNELTTFNLRFAKYQTSSSGYGIRCTARRMYRTGCVPYRRYFRPYSCISDSYHIICREGPAVVGLHTDCWWVPDTLYLVIDTLASYHVNVLFANCDSK